MTVSEMVNFIINLRKYEMWKISMCGVRGVGERAIFFELN